MRLDPEQLPLFAVACGLLGLVVGSFLNVVIYRVPRILMRGWGRDAAALLADDDVAAELRLDGSDRATLKTSTELVAARLAALTPLGIALPASTCPSCGHRIRVIENVPIVSWLFLRGRCSACKSPISARYPFVEGITGVLFAAAGWHFGANPTLLAALALVGALVALTLIDADTMLLPDSVTLSLMWLGLLVNLTPYGFAGLRDALIGTVAGYLAFWSIAAIFRLLRGIEGMGGGDFKLLAALGAWFGWQALVPIVLLAAGVGSLVGLTLMAMRRATMLSRLPFGVYLAPAGIVMLFFGPRIIAIVLTGGS